MSGEDELGPDGCPVHYGDPSRTVLVDFGGGWIQPMTARVACDGHHLGVIINEVAHRAISRSAAADQPEP